MNTRKYSEDTVMVCKIRLYDEPQLRDPILVEGLPGIGLVANIAVAYLVKKLDAKFFGEVRSSSFQDIAITDGRGGFGFPDNKFYYYKAKREGEHDLILLFGNTQALTAHGQYELCDCILDAAVNLGCHYIITLGGYRPGRAVTSPKLYYAASDSETAETAAALGAQALAGEIFGMAGLLVGLSGIRGTKGFCLLAETPGNFPDRKAAHEVLRAISGILGLQIDLTDVVVDSDLLNVMAPFDFGALAKIPKKERGPQWFI